MALLSAPPLLGEDGESARHACCSWITTSIKVPPACNCSSAPFNRFKIIAFSHASTTASPRSSSTERLWKEYFADPSQWWDNRDTKANPRYPDFKHRITKEPLWIDSWNNPSWVKDMLEKTDATSEGMDNSKEYRDWEVLGLEEALTSLEQMPDPPSVEILTCILRKCRKERRLVSSLRLHAYLRKNALEAHRSLGNYLVPMLVDVGSIHDAQQVFDKLVDRNEFSWTALITGYIECGEPQHALMLYQTMQEESVRPSGHTFVALLKACAKLKDGERGQQIHAEIAKRGLLDRDPYIGNALVSMYTECGLLEKALDVFGKLPVRDAVSWNALITWYAEHGPGEEALKCLEQMQLDGLSPDAVTFVGILKACGSIGAVDKGSEIHAEVARKGLLERNPLVGSTLVDMYAKCGSLAKAREVFDELPVRDAVLWTALIAGYVEHGHGQEALKCFEQMQLEGISPDVVTFVCSLKACGSIGAIDKGREIHAEIARRGWLERGPFVASALVDMHAKCGSLAKAQEVFDMLQVRDVVSWTALITGYAEHGSGQAALMCFDQMQLEGISPNVVTYICSLKACGSIGALEKGRDIHAEVARNGLLQRDPFVGSTLVDMYAKCGSLTEAREVFDMLQVRDAVSYNTLITGYAHLGESEKTFHMLDRMRGDGIKPNGVTFICVLTVCSHTGLVDKGQMYFEAMSKDYGITPSIEHYTCMVDLLGRAGQLDEAVAMIKKMPFTPTLVIWLTLLGACRKWGNVELARLAFEHAVQLDQKYASTYVSMSNIYANAHMLHDTGTVEVMRVNTQACKKPGESWWIDVGGVVHSFLVQDMRHSQSIKINAKLADIFLKMEEEGCVPDLHWVSGSLSDDEKNAGLCGHSEKLAIACALINTPMSTPIHIVKNLRVCNDCHSATAFVSKIEQRTILLKDAKCFHVFKEGNCTCRDHW